MLEFLHIRNLALVPEADIEFDPGFNVLTGETGTGKSLVIGALRLVTGQRASRYLIREGAERCDISAGFCIADGFQSVGGEIREYLRAHDIPDCSEQDGQLLLRRAITEKGSRCFVNGTAVPVKILSRLGDFLVDIHGPEQHHSLLRPSYQRYLLDSYAGIGPLVNECSGVFDAWVRAYSELERLQTSVEGEDASFLREQANEIRQAEIRTEEDQQVFDRHALLSRAKNMVSVANECRRGLCEEENAVIDQLGRILRYAKELEEADQQAGKQICERIEEAVDVLNEVGVELDRYADTLEFDQSEYNALEERMATLQRLKRKYGPTLDDVLATADELESRCLQAENRQYDIEKKQTECREFQQEYHKLSEKLRGERIKAATPLGAAISEKLKKLGFANSFFQVDVNPGNSSRWGKDNVEFSFAPNVEQHALPIRDIASSGEIARVLLAVKTVLSSADNVPTLVFDEVDANIGGNVAVRVAEELASIGREHQTICITHLPQIASAGERHYRVTKFVEGGRTITSLADLNNEQREEELARMLGRDGQSEVALAHAREMLAEAERKE